MDVIFSKEFISVAVCFLIVISSVTCITTIDIAHKLNLFEEYLKYDTKLLEQIKAKLNREETKDK